MVVLLVNNTCLGLLPKLLPLGLTWNWIGKGSASLLAVVFIWSFKKLPRSDYGFTTTVQPNTWKPIAYTFLFVSLLLAGLQYGVDGFSGVNVETLLFQATMPGIAEELVYRGILLALLNDWFGRPWKLGGAAMGWGSVITSLLFGLAHGILIGKGFSLHVDLVTAIFTGLLGFLMAWARERSGSLVPAILGHNLINFSSSF